MLINERFYVLSIKWDIRQVAIYRIKISFLQDSNWVLKAGNADSVRFIILRSALLCALLK